MTAILTHRIFGRSMKPKDYPESPPIGTSGLCRPILCLIVLTLFADVVVAQNRRYQPSRPISPSPYFRSALGPYRRAELATQDRQTRQIQQQNQQLLNLRGRVAQQDTETDAIKGQIRRLATGIGPTGIGSSFMNYSHYYQGLPGNQRPAGRTSLRNSAPPQRSSR